MIKAIENWLERKADEARQEEYDSGFGYAATQILKYGIDMSEIEHELLETRYDTGVEYAYHVISDLQSKAKKLERIEAENKDLRIIVETMQTEIRTLYEWISDARKVISSTPTGKPKLPFSEEHIPEWAKWVAQDADGKWYSYEKRPYLDEDPEMGQWIENSRDGKVMEVRDSEVQGDWKTTLYQVSKQEV